MDRKMEISWICGAKIWRSCLGLFSFGLIATDLAHKTVSFLHWRDQLAEDRGDARLNHADQYDDDSRRRAEIVLKNAITELGVDGQAFRRARHRAHPQVPQLAWHQLSRCRPWAVRGIRGPSHPQR
jgi:hypothetical protein